MDRLQNTTSFVLYLAFCVSCILGVFPRLKAHKFLHYKEEHQTNSHVPDNFHIAINKYSTKLVVFWSLNFYLVNMKKIFQRSQKEHLKISKIAEFGGEMLQNTKNITQRRFRILYILSITHERESLRHLRGKCMVGFLGRNTTVYKFCKLRGAIFSVFHNISSPNFAVLLIFRCSL